MKAVDAEAIALALCILRTLEDLIASTKDLHFVSPSDFAATLAQVRGRIEQALERPGPRLP